MSGDLDRVLQFVGRLEQAVRGQLPAEHWRIILDFDSVKLQLVGNPPPASSVAHTPDPLGERVGCYFTRAMITTTPDEWWERVIEDRVGELVALARRAFLT